MLLIFVTFEVSKSGTSFKEEQVRNMLLVFVTFEVLKNGIFVNERQASNMLLMFVTFDVSNKGTLFKLKQSENIDDVFVTLDVLVSLLNVTISNDLQSINADDILVNKALVLPISTRIKLCMPLKALVKLAKLPILIKLA
jgi:hypothetical protein